MFFDVDTCNDLAKALGVKAEIVETPFPDRIPALVSGRADVGVASTSDTLQRAKTIGFSVPYFVFKMVVLTKKGTNIGAYNTLKGRKTGSVTGTYEAIALEKDIKKWNDPKGSFRAYQTQADVFLALSQGQIEATVVTSTVAAATIKAGKYKDLQMGGDAPYDLDYVSLIALRQEYGLLRYLDLFVHLQFCKKYNSPCLAFVQVNRDGITKDTSDIISQSDRLLWLSTSCCVFKAKDREEMIEDGGKGSGNRKLFALKCRFGEPLEYGDYLCMNFDGAKTKITEIGTKFELSKK